MKSIYEDGKAFWEIGPRVPRHHEPRPRQPDRTIPNSVSIGPPPATGKRGSRGIPREAGAVPIATTRMIAAGAAGNVRAAMGDLEMWLG